MQYIGQYYYSPIMLGIMNNIEMKQKRRKNERLPKYKFAEHIITPTDDTEPQSFDCVSRRDYSVTKN